MTGGTTPISGLGGVTLQGAGGLARLKISAALLEDALRHGWRETETIGIPRDAKIINVRWDDDAVELTLSSPSWPSQKNPIQLGAMAHKLADGKRVTLVYKLEATE